MDINGNSKYDELLSELRSQRENVLLLIQDVKNLKEDIGTGFCNIDAKLKNDYVSKRELLELERKFTYSILGLVTSIVLAIAMEWMNR